MLILMLSDKQIKKKYLPVFLKKPEKYYPVKVLKKEGFSRSGCKSCGRYFWSVESSEVCGDPSCRPDESFGFIGKSPAKNSLSYSKVWEKFSKMFNNFGYTPIKRYPIVARWNPTMEYTNASIAAFQPYVISGEVTPPANPLVIPQFCFRTVDIDNVGITGSHNTVFNMIGQHQFVTKEKWNQGEVFGHIHSWINKGLGLDNKDVIFHEDAWAGGGNLGPCMEFFSKGCEIGNQVYMMYEQTSKGVQDLNIKVLDMGMGMERNAWFSQGTNTIYDATFPKVLDKLFLKTSVKYDKKMISKYVPHSGGLNIDEVDDINKAWEIVAGKVGVNVEELKENVLPLSGVYSIAEHARSLLILLNDGALPSNSGQAYNIRAMYRRALGFITKYNWDVDLGDVCEWHAKDLKIFPELGENLEEVKKILDVERVKYYATVEKSKRIVKDVVSKGKVDVKEMIKLYDEKGVSPEVLAEEAKKSGVSLEVPGNFYSLVGELHEKREQVHSTKKEVKLDLEGIPDTEALYFDDYLKDKSKGGVLFVKDDYVVLDKTIAYPTSGGQLHDIGNLNGFPLIDVFKQGGVIVHKVEGKFKVGDKVDVVIDRERRKQLAQHHTATHVMNAAARKVLGNHINQAGAFKDVNKARIDITHYSALSDEELKDIEEEANKIVKKGITVEKKFMARGEAEKKYGMVIYQGGAVPGKSLRIVDIKNVDVECCGGTHLDNTIEVGGIKILKSSKISDAVVRIEYVAGLRAEEHVSQEKDVLENAASLLGCEVDQVPGRAEELFILWKQVVKKKKEVKDRSLKSKERFSGDVLGETARVLKTTPENIVKTLERFRKDLGL